MKYRVVKVYAYAEERFTEELSDEGVVEDLALELLMAGETIRVEKILPDSDKIVALRNCLKEVIPVLHKAKEAMGNSGDIWTTLNEMSIKIEQVLKEVGR